ncbi:MAG: hypothetical protein WCE99_06315 [Nitrososphaeraceae archaeon]
MRLPSSSTSTITFNTDSLLFDRKLESVTEGLPREFLNLLNKLSKEDLMTVLDYMVSLKTEINPSENYRGCVIKIVTKFIIFCRLSNNAKPLKQLGREDVLAFLNSFRKSESKNKIPSYL